MYAQNLFIKFAGVTSDQTKLKIGVKESDKMIDFVTLKAYIFPYINLVWIGLIIMAVGACDDLIQHARMSKAVGAGVLIFAAAELFSCSFFANA